MQAATRSTDADIVDTLIGESEFRTLIGALQSTTLIDLLKQSGPFTLFAPTDTAFAKLEPGAITNLEKPENQGQLQELLVSHVVKGRHGISDLRQRLSVESWSGATHALFANSAGVRVGDAAILGNAIECTNGVIHVVDSVLTGPFRR